MEMRRRKRGQRERKNERMKGEKQGGSITTDFLFLTPKDEDDDDVSLQKGKKIFSFHRFFSLRPFSLIFFFYRKGIERRKF